VTAEPRSPGPRMGTGRRGCAHRPPAAGGGDALRPCRRVVSGALRHRRARPPPREIMQALERRGGAGTCICNTTLRMSPGACGCRGRRRCSRPLVRFPRRGGCGRAAFASTNAPRGRCAGRYLIAFNGTALAQIRAARRMACVRLADVCELPHAARDPPARDRPPPVSDRAALGHAAAGKNLAEYAESDTIHVASRLRLGIVH